MKIYLVLELYLDIFEYNEELDIEGENLSGSGDGTRVISVVSTTGYRN